MLTYFLDDCLTVCTILILCCCCCLKLDVCVRLSVCLCVCKQEEFIYSSKHATRNNTRSLSKLFRMFCLHKNPNILHRSLVTMVDILQNMEDPAVIYFFKRYMSSFVDVLGNSFITCVCFYTYFFSIIFFSNFRVDHF